MDPSVPVNTGKEYYYQYEKGILPSIQGRYITINTGKEYYHQYGKGILPSIWGRNITINMGKVYYHQYGKGMLPSIWGRNININMGKVYYHQYGKGMLPSIWETNITVNTGEEASPTDQVRGLWLKLLGEPNEAYEILAPQRSLSQPRDPRFSQEWPCLGSVEAMWI